MFYQYRRWYAFTIVISIFLMGYWYDLLPKHAQIETLKQTKKQLENKIAKLSSLAKHKQNKSNAKSFLFAPYTHQERMSELVTLANTFGITLQHISTNQSNHIFSDHDTLVKIVVQADFNKITAFLSALLNTSNPFAILDFSCEAAENQTILFTAQLLISSYSYLDHKITSPLTQISHYPFCLAKHSLPIQKSDDLIQLQQTPISQLKMVGYIQAGTRNQALIQLRNNRTIAVYPGVQIGKEQGVITFIERKRINIRLRDHTLLILENNHYAA